MTIFNSRDERYAIQGQLRTFKGAASVTSIGPFPVLANPQPGTIGATSLTNATVLTDTFGGTVYMAVVTNGGSATDAQIIAGSGGSIVAGAASSVAVASGALQTVASITGLTTATTYQLLALQVAPTGQHSSQVSKTFTTA